jgi:hypothetical protein
VDIWDYFERHQRECRSLGLVESDNFPIQYFAMEGCNDMRGLILGRYDLGDRAFVGAKEIVEIVEGNYPQRVQYAYYLIVDGFEEFARERDPSHHPAVHGHGRSHRWEPAEPITFVRFVNEAWNRVSDLADESLADGSLGGGIAP